MKNDSTRYLNLKKWIINIVRTYIKIMQEHTSYIGFQDYECKFFSMYIDKS